MKARRDIRLGSWILCTTSIFVALAGVPAVGAEEPAKGYELRVVKLPPEAMRAPTDLANRIQAKTLKRPKLASQFVEVLQIRAARGEWKAKAESIGISVSDTDDSVLAEIRLHPGYTEAVRAYLMAENARVRDNVVPTLMNVWVPIDSLEKIADHPDVMTVRMARRAIHHAVTSEGVAAGNADIFHSAGFSGAGVVFANVDGGYENFDTSQGTGDWPSVVDKYVVTGGVVTGPCINLHKVPCSSFETGGKHGTATTEINYDMAPDSTFKAYWTDYISDWYLAFKHAADNGADVISCSLGAPLDNVGDGRVCPPGWGSPCGTIAEAAEYARNAGVLIANSAGNERIDHWGDAWVDSGDGTLDWDGAGSYGNINAYGPVGTSSVYCIPDGYPIDIDMYWSDWTAIDEDLDLYVLEYQTGGWTGPVAYSNYSQDGTAGCTPQEIIRWTAADGDTSDPICGAGSAAYGLYVPEYTGYEVTHPTDITLFAYYSSDPTSAGLWVANTDRSLGFPADSPDVFTCGAIDVADETSLEPYSSAGPILSPGGYINSGTPTHNKPDGGSFDNVTTSAAAYGPTGFGGTSASAPHIAGVAALLKELHPYATADELETEMHEIGLTGANDLGTAGFDTEFGYGRITLDPRGPCKKTMSALTPNQWTMIGLPCEVRTWNQVGHMFDNDGLGTLDSDWEIWQRDEAAGAYSQLGLTDVVQQGRGLWIMANSAGTVTVEGINPDTSQNFAISLIGGAGNGRPNLIGYPFSFDVDWQDVLVYYKGSEHSMSDAIAANQINATMWKTWDGSQYAVSNYPAGQLNEFDGFWVKAKQNVELRIPNVASKNPSPIGITNGWRVNLDAQAATLTANAQLGHLSDSIDGHDNFDVELMPPFGDETISIVFPHPRWGEYADDYVRDMRAPASRERWAFEIRTSEGLRTVALRWSGPRKILRNSVLIDLTSGKKIDLDRLSDTYTFEAINGVQKFVWKKIK